MVFAVLLMALTLGINVVLPWVDGTGAGDTAQKTTPAQPVQVTHAAQVN